MSASSQPDQNLGRWAQVSLGQGAQIVRVVQRIAGNTYAVEAMEFDEDGVLRQADPRELTVTNLAEPVDSSGQVAEETTALAVDLEGRWVILVPPPSSAMFLAKVTAAHGSAAYTVVEQVGSSVSNFTDKPGATGVTAQNLAELATGSGSATDIGTLVLVQSVTQPGDPPSLRYVFDHPIYAKYL